MHTTLARPLARAALTASMLGVGLLGTVHSAAAQALSPCTGVVGNLVANCGFESGSFSGYTRTGNTASSGVDMFSAHSGSYGAYFANRGASQTLAQTLATTAGARYAFSFFLLSEDVLPGTAFVQAFFGGQQVFNLVGQAPLDYTQYQFTVTATGPTTEMQFVVENDPSFYQLDDVSVALAATTIPEPASVVLVGAGLLGLATAGRRRQS